LKFRFRGRRNPGHGSERHGAVSPGEGSAAFALNLEPRALNSTPQTLHVKAQTFRPMFQRLHAKLQTLHPTSYTMHHAPSTQHPAPSPHPKSLVTSLKPYILIRPES
jgi:hypothetical protein